MWLKNDALNVFFDERRGGMPVRDSLGFLRAASIEIAYKEPFPYFQSLNDKHPRVTKHSDSKLMASGVMRKGNVVTPHTYEMTATLEGNRLNLAYKLNVAITEKVIRSKIWLFSERSLLRCEVSGNPVDKAIETSPAWDVLYVGIQPTAPITLMGPSGRLKIFGATNPSVYARVYRLKKYPKLEVVYGWAYNILQEGTYTGDLILTYEGSKCST